MPPRQEQLWDQGDDWSGVASAAERRRLQNRLNQRASRKKKLYQRVAPKEPQKVDDKVAVSNPPMLVLLKCPEMRQGIAEFIFNASLHWRLGNPTPDDLPMLTRVNVVDAIFKNARTLYSSSEPLAGNNYWSPFTLQGPELPDLSGGIPPALRPTALQKEVQHKLWVDILPIPGLRDNILRAIKAGEFEPRKLCQELLCGDLVDLGMTTTPSLIIWGESWDARNWEFGPSFFRKWGFLVRGCPGVLETSNSWREKRGEMALDFVLN